MNADHVRAVGEIVQMLEEKAALRQQKMERIESMTDQESEEFLMQAKSKRLKAPVGPPQKIYLTDERQPAGSDRRV